MAKNTDYSKKLFRFVKILNKLETEGKVSTRELAEEFNVNIRTAQRNIELLNQAEFPLVPVAKGTYSFMPGFSLRRLPLTNEEASLLAFLCEVASSMGGEFATSFRSLLSKAVLSADGQSPFHAITNIGTKGNYPAMPDLQAAIEENREIEILYANGKKHQIQPLKIIHSEGFWYVLARIKGRKDYTPFRLDRIRSVEVLATTFKPPKNLGRALTESTSIWGDGQKRNIRVVLRVVPEGANYFESAIYFPRQKILRKQRDGSLLLETRISHFMEAIPVIKRWIPFIHVVQPRALKEELRTTLRGYLRGLA